MFRKMVAQVGHVELLPVVGVVGCGVVANEEVDSVRQL